MVQMSRKPGVARGRARRRHGVVLRICVRISGGLLALRLAVVGFCSPQWHFGVFFARPGYKAQRTVWRKG
ncbi:uncharacterized protein BDV17DRAFT_256319 [Aspergillus undulatus]|uniref:uncharacterized protein n=1 Tax=Aspergillus undulatus TaxID=1810928 RepID=UPI003CCCA9F6